MTEEQMGEQMRAWDEWREHPEARFMAVDSAILCWK